MKAKFTKSGKPVGSTRPDGYLKAGVSMVAHFTPRQVRYSHNAAGLARLCYNLARDTHRFCRVNRLPWPSAGDIRKEFNAMKAEGFPFAAEVSKFVSQDAFANFGAALSNWMNKNLPAGPPLPKSKKKTAPAYCAALGADAIRYGGHRSVRLPVLGRVRLAEPLPTGYIPYEARVSLRNGLWYISFQVWKPPVTQPERDSQTYCGADVGSRKLAVDSLRTEYPNPKPYEKAQEQLTMWQRRMARRDPGGKNWLKAKAKVNRLHRRVVGIRKNNHHQVSLALVRRFHTLGIESLHVKGLMRNGRNAKVLADAAMSRLLEMVRYKAEWHGTRVVVADRFFPSSKTCFDCGFHHVDLGSEERWACPNCGVDHDRDFNAACNLLKLALAVVIGEVTPTDLTALARRLIAAPGETVVDEVGTDIQPSQPNLPLAAD